MGTFARRYRLPGPILALMVSGPVFFAIDEHAPWKVVAALGIGTMAAAVVCLGWDLWLHP
ncbi:hypothetical protein OG225_26145 [Nocardia sp. NBC_01377]|uniref:hypothetical protein n=1 Tax=Nocardia sp. NBC_01377 TaxID=2903595 RepID=UPI00324A172E